MIEYILYAIFFLLLVFYSSFLAFIWVGLNRLKSLDNDQIPEEFVSIIIPFRNESENILANATDLVEQEYPKENYEIIYVNDNSIDDSLEKIKKFKENLNFRILSVPDEYSAKAHKKRAIRYGIENSFGNIIVTTDADCRYSTKWLSALLKNMDNETGFISGPVEFIEERKIFSRIQKLDFAGLVIAGAGLVGAAKPTICNAANIAYRRKVYEEVKGFYEQMDLSSGDDELLMQKIDKNTNYKIRFSLDKESVVKTKGNSTISEFYHQRKRWASKGLFYKNYKLIFVLILIYLFYLGLFIQPFLLFFLSYSFIITFALSILTKFSLEYIILNRGKKLLFDNLSTKFFLVTEFLQIAYIIVAGFMGIFGNLKWKERRISR